MPENQSSPANNRTGVISIIKILQHYGAKDLQSEEDQDAAYSPLRAIKNLFARWVITSDETATNSDDGIKVTNVLDFLTSE